MDKLADLLSSGIIICDPSLRVHNWNRWLEFQTGIQEENARDQHLHELFPNIHAKTLTRRINTTLMLNSPAFYSPSEGYLIPIKNEKIANPVFSHMQQGIKILPYEPESEKVMIIINDHTEMKEAYQRLEKATEKAHYYLDIIDKNVLSLITDENGIIVDASEAFCERVRGVKEELIGQKSSLFRHPDTPDELYESLWRAIKSGQTWQGELRNKTLRGEEFWVKTTIFYLEEENGSIRYQAIQQDITDKKKVEAISITDELTKLYNRRYFNQIFNTEIHRAMRQKSTLAFTIMDIDNFKLYNDTYGHQEGDNVLIAVGALMQKLFRRGGDYTFRLGGEEFGILLNECEPKYIIPLVDNLRKELQALDITHEHNTPAKVVTASMGIYIADFRAVHGPACADPDFIYKMADEALYKAKESGRNRLEVFGFSDDA